MKLLYVLLISLSLVLSAVNADIECKKAGFVRDPKQCDVFYRCIQIGKIGLKGIQFKCDPGMAFDTKLNECIERAKLNKC